MIYSGIMANFSDPQQISLVNRSKAAQLVGKSKSQIRRYEKDGLLTPIKNDRGWNCYEYEQVLQLRRTLHLQLDDSTSQGFSAIDGETTAQAFALFDEGCDGAEVVQRLKLTAEQGKMLVQSYAELKGGLFVSAATVSQMVDDRLVMPEGIQNSAQWSRRHQHIPITDEQALKRAVARAFDWACDNLLETSRPANFAQMHTILHAWLESRLNFRDETQQLDARAIIDGEEGENSTRLGKGIPIQECSGTDNIASLIMDRIRQELKGYDEFDNDIFAVDLFLVSKTQTRQYLRLHLPMKRRIEEAGML